MESDSYDLSRLLEDAPAMRVIDRYCMDQDDVRFWQGNLKLQFERAEAPAFLRGLIAAFKHPASALGNDA